MANIAILAGNDAYTSLNPLSSCNKDVNAVRELLSATGKYDTIKSYCDVSSSTLKDRMRSFLNEIDGVDELFFYFSGHGYSLKSDFYFCGVDFDKQQPNQTGFSNNDLHVLLRSVDAALIVKVIDACNSGILLVKSDQQFIPLPKDSISQIIQIASCQSDQTSMAGDPLSEFTERFIDAALSKTDGKVYYQDIANVLADMYLNNPERRPHFVTQGTYREIFVEDAHRLDTLRKKIGEQKETTDDTTAVNVESRELPSVLEQLKALEKDFTNRETAQHYIDDCRGKLVAQIEGDKSINDLFEPKVVTHDEFSEHMTEDFIIAVMSRQSRPDNFVHAESKMVHKKRKPENLLELNLGMGLLGSQKELVEEKDLYLNCSMKNVQFKVVLNPRMKCLSQVKLIMSFAPSLEYCFTFCYVSKHGLKDWSDYEIYGTELDRSWYQIKWAEPPDFMIAQVFEGLQSNIEDHVTSVLKEEPN